MYDDMMNESALADGPPEEPTPEPSLLASLLAKARAALGLDDVPADSTAGQAVAGAKILSDLATPSGPKKDKDGLLIGHTRGIIHENVRTLKAKGLSEEEAIRRAHAAADRSAKAGKK